MKPATTNRWWIRSWTFRDCTECPSMPWGSPPVRPCGSVAATVEAPEGAQADDQGFPIRQGPESRSLERIQLGFWGGSTDLELLDSGFGPFALERLCRATGGTFLALRPSPQDFSVMRAPSPTGLRRVFPASMRRS